MSARELYETSIRPLPALERLRLASIILEELSASGGKAAEMSDHWSGQDIAELLAFSLSNAAGDSNHVEKD